MTTPAQKPGRSRQDVGTPPEFIAAVQRRFGHVCFDLAAHADNRCALRYYGAGGEAEDSLEQPWHQLDGLLWLNSEFADIAPWAEKCAHESRLGARIASLWPASIGTDWFREHVHGTALVLGLSPRLTFVGCKDPYPKDLMLCLWGPWVAPGFDCWKWNRTP